MLDGCGYAIANDTQYYIQDTRGQVGNCILWWGKDKSGYVCDIRDAGIYDGAFVNTLRDTDLAWPIDVVEQHVVTHVRKDALDRYLSNDVLKQIRNV